jgi:hypothetical protein
MIEHLPKRAVNILELFPGPGGRIAHGQKSSTALPGGKCNPAALRTLPLVYFPWRGFML